MGKSKKGMVFRAWIVLPVLLMGIYALWINPNKDVRAAEAIAISDINDLKKIGQDSAYPMNGDYILTNDIDYNNNAITPIGICGVEGYSWRDSFGNLNVDDNYRFWGQAIRPVSE